MYLLTNDGRQAAVWINYKRLDPNNLNPQDAMGPNYNGERLWPVAVDLRGQYDRLGLSYVPPGGYDYTGGEEK